MDWNTETESTPSFVPHPDSSFSSFYNYYNSNPYSGMEGSEMALSETQQRLLHVTGDEMNMINSGNGYREKKKKITSNQIDFLERCFQEDIKLDSERKMNLSRELGLQPRQITVWFQNRRTRWKTKQLQHSYDLLKQENRKLQKEVMELKEKLKEKAHCRTQTYGEETIESILEGLPCRNIEGEPYPCFNMTPATTSSIQQAAEGCDCDHSSFTVEDFDSVSTFHECHWPNLPYYP